MKNFCVSRLGGLFVVAACMLGARGAWSADEPAPPKPRPGPAPNAATVLAKQKLELSNQIKAVNALALEAPLNNIFLDSVAKHTGNSVQSLEAAKRKSSLSYGDLVVAFTLANATSLKLDQIKTEHRTRTWADMALLRRVKLTDLIEKLQAVQDDVDKAIEAKEKEPLQPDRHQQPPTERDQQR